MLLCTGGLRLVHRAERPSPQPAPCRRPLAVQRCGRSPRRPAVLRQAGKDGSSETAADILAETEALLAELGKREPPPPSGYLSDEDSRLADYRFTVSCDVNGCVIQPVTRDRAGQPGPAGLASPVQTSFSGPVQFAFHEGDGWKIGVDEAAESQDTYSAVIGSDSWSIALSKQEFVDFIQLLKNLRRSVTTLDICGQWGEAGDDATLEMETPSIWMQGRAPQKRLSTLQDYWRHGDSSAASMDGEDLSSAFALRFIVKSAGRREVEGNWYAETVMSVFQFLDSAQGGFISQIPANDGLAPAAQEARL